MRQSLQQICRGCFLFWGISVLLGKWGIAGKPVNIAAKSARIAAKPTRIADKNTHMKGAKQ